MLREIGFKQVEYKKIEYPKNLGLRTKLGGLPEWIQEEVTPKCKSCKKEMVFVSQIDSIDYGKDIKEKSLYMFGDVGMIYTFFCFGCMEVKSIFQTY